MIKLAYIYKSVISPSAVDTLVTTGPHKADERVHLQLDAVA